MFLCCPLDYWQDYGVAIMRDYFDTAYEYFCEALSSFKLLFSLMFGCLVYLTLPIWVIPYLIIKKRTEGKDDEKDN